MTPSPPDELKVIVRWLRDKAEGHFVLSQQYQEKKISKGEYMHTFRGATLCDVADAIERGEHLSEQGEGYE